MPAVERSYLPVDGPELLRRAKELIDSSELAGAEQVLTEAIAEGLGDAHYGLGEVAHRRGDGDAAIAHFKTAADSADTLRAWAAFTVGGLLLVDAQDLEAALPWMVRADELGARDALNYTGVILNQLGRVDEAMDAWRTALAKDDANAAQNLAVAAARANDESAFEELSTKHGELAIARELESHWWARDDLDYTLLDNRQIMSISEASQRFMAPYKQQFESGERDPFFMARATAAAGVVTRVAKLVAGASEEQLRRSRYAASVSRRAYESEYERIVGVAPPPPKNAPSSPPSDEQRQPIREMPPIRGCRLVAGPGRDGVPNTILTVRAPEVVQIRLPTEPQPISIPWEAIDSFEIEPIPHRGRVTGRRVAALGPLALAAKKREPWCVLTINWSGRFRTLEVPAQAHELRAAFHVIGISV